MAFDRNRRGGFERGRGSFGGGRDRQMFKITCSNCGKEAQVPFEPRGDKPVYCSDCFEKMHPRTNDRDGGRDSRDRGGRDGRDRGSSDLGAQITSLNAKLDRIINLLQNQNPSPKQMEPKKPEEPKSEELKTEITEVSAPVTEEPVAQEEKPKKKTSKKKSAKTSKEESVI
jgi:CxxC-x17-CxxC domain-containing protein